MFNGLTIGCFGTFIGTCLGMLLCELLKRYQFIELNSEVYIIDKLPVLLKTTDVIMIVTAALFICFLATLYPAHQASKIDPVEAIRYG